jgi:hypothetical protein
MPTRFRTLKVIDSLFRDFSLVAEFRDRKLTSVRRELTAVDTARRNLWSVASYDLEKWSRSHRKLHGRKARLDDYLLEHNATLRQCLTDLETAVSKLDRDYYDGEERAVLDRGYAAINNLWMLDLKQEDAYKKVYTAPRPVEDKPTISLDWVPPIFTRKYTLRLTMSEQSVFLSDNSLKT